MADNNVVPIVNDTADDVYVSFSQVMDWAKEE